MLEADHAFGIDDEGLGHAVDAPLDGGAAVAVSADGRVRVAVLREPRAYESIDPAAFGRERKILIGSRLTGRNAIAHRARTLGLELSSDDLRQLTQQIKASADQRLLASHEVDQLILGFQTAPIQLAV